MTVYLIERHGVEESYTVAVYANEEDAQTWIDSQEDHYMYEVEAWEVES